MSCINVNIVDCWFSFEDEFTKALLKALSAVVVLSLGQMAMANVVTDAGGAVVDGVKTVGSTLGQW